jgi:hypothetical protein
MLSSNRMNTVAANDKRASHIGQRPALGVRQMDSCSARILLDTNAPVSQCNRVVTKPLADGIYEHRMKIAAVY